jgi:hypothetical protein
MKYAHGDKFNGSRPGDRGDGMAKTFSCSHCGTAIPMEGLRSGSLTKCPSCAKDSFVPLQFVPRGDSHLRCPKCTARFDESESVCRHCKSKLPGPNTRRRKAEEVYLGWVRRWKKILLTWAAALVAVAAWLLWPQPQVQPADEVCGSNLRFLYSVFEAGTKSPSGVPSSTGSRFWTDLMTTAMGPVAPACNAAIRSGRGGTSGYRGPLKPVRDLPGTAPIACDFSGLHPGGVAVLLKNGTIYIAPAGTREHDQALEQTKE